MSTLRSSRRARLRGLLAAAVAAAAIAALAAGSSPILAGAGQAVPEQKPAPEQQQKPASDQPASGEKPASQEQAPEQRPRFRTEANFVRVDAYPTRDGRPVQDLRRDDFQVLEDGKPQEIATFEHVVIQAGGPQEARVEPTTVGESREMVADPRARLFVLFLDTYHVRRESAWNVRRSLSRVLERAIAPTDFVAVMTPEMSAGSVTFTRRTGSIDELLDKWITWGRRGNEYTANDPVEENYKQCYPNDASTITVGEFGTSGMAREMILRRREKLALDAVRDLVNHLAGLREERKAILMVSEGWALYRPNTNLARPTGPRGDRVPGPPPVGVGPEGGLRVGDLGRNPGGGTYACDQDRLRLAQEDHDQEFRYLLDEANRANASFYAIDPRGLPVFDGAMDEPQTTGPATDQAMLRGRQDSLRTLSTATDGIAVMNSNDIDKGLQRVVDDLTSYYLLGYYSPAAQDGKFHAIKVNVKRSGVDVRARRGYRSPTREEVAAAVRGESARRAEESPVERAIATLSKIRREAFVRAAAGYDWQRSDAGEPAPSLWVALELDANAARDEQWRVGADVAVAVSAADKTAVSTSDHVLRRDARATLLRLPLPAAVPGDYTIRVTSKPAGATLGSSETLRVVVPRPKADTALYGQAILYRRGPFTGTAWQAAADPRFRRQERVKVEVPLIATAPAVSVSGQLLDRTGKPLAVIPVAAASREEGGRTIVSSEVTLAPLATGDYVLETTIRLGEATHKVVTAFRIVP